MECFQILKFFAPARGGDGGNGDNGGSTNIASSARFTESAYVDVVEPSSGNARGSGDDTTV